MNIVLTGFMGTGKSTVGRLLAARLGRRFIDTDAVIEDRHGPIPQIFARDGEASFRELERQLADELTSYQDLVVATGGGMLLNPEVSRIVAETGTIVCLTAPVNQILARVLNDPSPTERPLLAGPDPAAQIDTLLRDRAQIYGQFEQIATGDRTPNEIVDQILLKLKLNDSAV